MDQNFSYGRQIWHRLKKNKTAFAGLIIIFFSILVALFAYIIAPDNTPNADLQTVEIQAKKPGYTQLFLKIPDTKINEINWFSDLFTGKPAQYRYLPISSYTIKGNVLSVEKYIDEDTTVNQVYNIAQLTNNNPAQVNKLIITKKYWLGTDAYGRDILSRLIIGVRVSLAEA